MFIESELSVEEFIMEASSYIRNIDEAYRLLYYGERRNMVMKWEERLALKKLFGNNYCIESSVGLIEGDRIRVTSGALVGMESKIRKINRHKREAVVDFVLMGDKREVKVALEIIEKS